MKRAILMLLTGGLMLSVPVQADDVTDQIDEALSAYERKDLSTTLTALDTASALVRQAKAEQLSDLLPAPLSGWNAEEAESGFAGSAVMGGGINAERRYFKDDAEITISVASNSPMIQAMAMVFSNPMFGGAGQKIKIIDGRKVIAEEQSLQTVLGGAILVSVQGHEASQQDLKAYFKAIDFEGIEKAAGLRN